jgi:hypothetical protein
MRFDPLRRTTVATGCALALGCAVNLDPDPPRVPPATSAPALVGCLPLSDRVESLEGRVDWLRLHSESSILVAASARFDGKEGASGFAVSVGALADSCQAEVVPVRKRPLIEVGSLGTGLVGRPLGGLSNPGPFLFFAAENTREFRTEGYGIARWDPKVDGFVAVGLLWTGDRPSYGSAALVSGDYVYVYGGIAARFLAADAYLARVPLDALLEPAAYEYWTGGGTWTPNVDEALPLVEAGTSPSVVYDTAHSRFLMAYSTPLAGEITVRSGLGVTGPWSLPVTLGRCDLPSIDQGAFCGDVTLVPALAREGELALTQGVGSFERPEGATASDYWTRLVRVGWPVGVP